MRLREIAHQVSRGGALAGVWLTLLMGGCTLSVPPAPESTLSIPEHWRTDIGRSAPLEPLWWQSFGDQEMDRLVHAALTNNGDLRIAATRVREYEARLRVAGAARLPTLDASVTPGRARALNSTGTTTAATSLQAGLQAAYEVDLWGRIESLLAAARADYQGQEAAQLAARLSISATTATGYLNLLGLDEQLKLARATLASREESLNLARRQFETGYSSSLEWAQAQAEYHAATGAISQLERSIAQQENALNLLVGDNPGPITRGPGLAHLTLPAVPESLPSELLQRRPDILQAEQAVVSADGSLAAARDQLLPSVRISASTGLQGYGFTQLIDAPNQLWSIGGSILAPIFEGGRLNAQVDIAAATRDRAVYAYENTVRNAFAETENALSAVMRLKEQVVELAARQRAAAEALRIVHNRYRNGYSSYLEELDAQRTLYSVQVALIQMQTSVLVAQVDLYRALGGAW